MSSVLDLAGKFHPLLLHLPIGVLIYAYLHLGYDLFLKKKEKPVDISFALAVGAISAIMSSVSGYLLSLNGEYGGELLDWHKWLGIGTAVGAVLLYFVYNRNISTKQFFGVFSVFMALLTVTGHYGGSLTHGEGFLSLASDNEASPIVINDVNEAHIFDHLIMPIVDRKCVSCHNPKKTKGELLLNTIDGWKQGGKTGKFIVAGDLENSLMSIRAHLPLDSKEHMPPTGKLQLEKDEITFIDWWISNMSNYTHKVADLSPPVHIMNFIVAKLDYSIVGVPDLDMDQIRNLQASGIPVKRISEDKPWLSVDYTRGQKMTKSDINALLDVSENIRELKLSKVGLTDKLLTKLIDLKNLKTLDISLNDITSRGVSKLTQLEKLEKLNLYGTKVDVDFLEVIKEFKSLNTIYLWQTNITQSDIAKVNISENVKLNLGQDLDVFGTVQLTPPLLVADGDLFLDTMSVSLSHQGPTAKIRYTLDGSIPDETSLLYTEPIVINTSSEVTAVALMDGWQISEPVNRMFVKSSYEILQCKIDKKPNEKYAAEGPNTLTDLNKGSNEFGDGKWLGFFAEDIELTLDLGAVKMVKAVSFGSLRDYRSYIFNPIGAQLSLSTDGNIYQEVKTSKWSQITGPKDTEVVNAVLDIPESQARYIKLNITAQKKNPNWHSDPGADAWLFIDEVVVE